jgi:hypothetical protein
MPHMLLLAGTGRDSGKTLFGCRILSHLGARHTIYSLKITPHFHKGIRSGKVFRDERDFFISEELSPGSGKDSKRFIEAGAKRSFFMIAHDENLGDALEALFSEVSDHVFWVCESGGARQWIVPGLFMIISESKKEEWKPGSVSNSSLADRQIMRDGNEFDFPIENIQIGEQGWILTNT